MSKHADSMMQMCGKRSIALPRYDIHDSGLTYLFGYFQFPLVAAFRIRVGGGHVIYSL